ncbi:unnamed protein product, partial [Laminaria digitata]
MDISILVPFYNEEGNIKDLYDEIIEVMDKTGKTYEMVFVDDGSTDRTGEILGEISEGDDRVVPIHFIRNFGQTAAFRAAVENAFGDIRIGMDGDRQNDPHDIPAMLEKTEEGYDVVSGWRRER